MSKSASRTIILEPDTGESGEWVAPEQRFWEQLRYLYGVLMAVGGKVEIVADRVKLGEIPGEGGQPEPLAETVGFVIAWRTIPKLNERPMTVLALDYALGQQAEVDAQTAPQGTPERELEEEQATEEALLELAGALTGPVEEPPDEDPECDCEGDHVPPCPFAGTAAPEAEQS